MNTNNANSHIIKHNGEPRSKSDNPEYTMNYIYISNTDTGSDSAAAQYSFRCTRKSTSYPDFVMFGVNMLFTLCVQLYSISPHFACNIILSMLF